MMALFCWHLGIEKLLKAHWVKDNENNFAPRTYHLTSLHDQTRLNLSEEMQADLKIIKYTFMLTKQSAIETIGLFIADLKMLGYNPTQAWLFGSVVSEKTHAYSDIDLALWDNQFTGVLHIDGEKIKRLLLKYKLIELHSFSAASTEEEDPFIAEIKKTGERVL